MLNAGNKIVFIIILFFTFIPGVKSQSFSWARSSSGSFPSGGGPKGFATCVDINGNTFTTGYFSDAKAVLGSYTLTNAGSSSNDFFISKYDPNGNLLWVKNWGGTGDDQTRAICTDAGGNVIVTGLYAGSTLSIGTFTFANGGYVDMFLAKFDPNGNPIWANIANGGKGEVGTSVSCDTNGNVYVGGYFGSLFLWFGSIILNNTNTNNLLAINDAFIAKYDSNGNLLWAKNPTGTGADEFSSLEIDAAGDICVSGTFNSPTFTIGTCTLTNTTPGGEILLLKFDTNGNVIWGTKAAGAGTETCYSLCTDQNSNIYLTGSFQTPPISFGSITLSNSSGMDAFLVKYDSNGNPLWATNAISTGTFDTGYSVRSYSNDVLLIGQITGPSMTFGTYTINRPVNYQTPMFIAQFDQNGNIVYGTALSSGGNNCALALDKNCNAYITSGFTTNPYSLPFVVGTFSLTTATAPTFFLTKFNYVCSPTNLNDVLSEKNEIIIFPNPTNDVFEISMRGELNGIIEIYNVVGQLVLREKITQNGKFNISSCSSGFYSVLIKDEKGVLMKTIKVVKE